MRSTPLMQAAAGGRAENVAALLRAGAAVGAVNAVGATALHAAASSDQELRADAAACCEALLLAGASPDAEDDEGDTPLAHAIEHGEGAAAPVLLAFGSAVPEDAPAAVLREALPAAAALARRYLDALRAPATLSDAAALVEARLEAATADAGGESPFARLRALRSGALPWEHAWEHAPPQRQRRSRLTGAVDRVARAQALRACAEQAEAAAAERTIGVLRQRGGAPPGSAERRRLTYAAAMCVAQWWDVKQALRQAEVEFALAEAGMSAARAQGEETLARLVR